MSKGEMKRPDEDGRRRYKKGERDQITIKADVREVRAFRVIADELGLAFNETFVRLIELYLQQRGLSIHDARFDPPLRVAERGETRNRQPVQL